jgi:hypothetical protein
VVVVPVPVPWGDVVVGVVVVEPVVLVPVPVLVSGVHDSLTDVTFCVTGSEIADSGVPGGTLTSNVNVWPPATVTVITQPSS